MKVKRKVSLSVIALASVAIPLISLTSCAAETGKFFIRVATEGNGNTKVIGEKTEYKYNDQVTVQAIPDSGWSFAGWFDNRGTYLSDDLEYSFAVANSVNLVAHFSQNKYIVSVTADPAEGGTAVIYDAKTEYVYDDNATVKATVNPGYTFAGWYDKTGTKVSSELTYTFVVPDNTILTAKFTPNVYSIAVAADPGWW